ncbi:ribonuclease R [Blattabacterium sp. (Blaberus giganteus)]|uniref:ribonuclease R n=1 Tax=Blattabacterium sp. (Blaberus giganteus) TaxID=1186051 RepID=UPI00025F6F5E|nr:ribonuclease R [Blattabacterium sp. (Blaberus giganteus)]AFJ90785.1 ribonuclease R [Blattabacterium sp. (Blaberus giganteus)]
MKKERKIKKYNNLSIGWIRITNHGYAFVHINGFQKDVFIPKNKTNRALEGDLVEIKFYMKKGIKMEGEVLKIIKRKTNKFIGILKIHNNYGIVYNTNIHVNILVPIQKLEKCHHNDKVLVQIESWPKKFKNPFGKIVKVFGSYGEYKTEISSLLEEYEISYKFSKKMENEAKVIFSKKVMDIRLRRDMRKVKTFTIDPLNAKDFDDALSIRKLSYDTWEIGVHISDVSHYIKEGSLLDQEAYSRATSIYFVGEVIPMLPKILSNNLCSLQPKKDKLSFSYIFNINRKGKILKNWFGKTIIRSDRKFTYDEVQSIIDKKKGDYYEDIYTLFLLSKILIQNRLKNGALFLERVEVKFHLDKKNNPISLYLEKNNDAHRLIEEFMLLTNQKISEFVSLNLDGGTSKKLYIYRIHDKPDFQKIFLIKKIIEPLGYFLDTKNLKTSINHLLKQIKGKPEQNMIENLILRSMSKAKYSTRNIGHYGLSFIYYTHFTSPIRRYSDIIAHRLLYYYLTKDKNKNEEYKLKTIEFYEKQSHHCSCKERLAIDVEREFLKYMQVKYIRQFVGEEFYGIITGFTNWSVYIDLLLFQTEGMVRLNDIKEDSYVLNSNDYSIIGKKKRKIYHLGDKVKVKLMDANIEKNQIILDWIDDV